MSDATEIKYYIKAPLTLANDDTRDTYPIVPLQIAPGPVAVKDHETGETKTVRRKAQTLQLIRGEGVTTDKLVADYIDEQWPEIEVIPVAPDAEIESDAIKYRREIEQTAQRAQAQAAAKPTRRELAEQREKLAEDKAEFEAKLAAQAVAQ